MLGLGFATLIPQRGNVDDAHRRCARDQAERHDLRCRGAELAGAAAGRQLSARAGRAERPAPRQGRGIAGGHAWRRPADPTLLSDVFFRIGGAEAGRATDGLVVNADNAILDDVWAWRADHGAGAGWTTNPAATGVVVNGNNVNAYGLAVEHFQKDEVLWNGQHGRDVFFQNEMPYDPPSQTAWMSSPTNDGYAAFKLGAGVAASPATEWAAIRSSTRACPSTPVRRSPRRTRRATNSTICSPFPQRQRRDRLGDQRRGRAFQRRQLRSAAGRHQLPVAGNARLAEASVRRPPSVWHVSGRAPDRHSWFTSGLPARATAELRFPLPMSRAHKGD